MSDLFSPMKIGALSLKNRFIHSATYEVMAENNGAVTTKLIDRYVKLAQGGVGLIIPGYIYVHPWGRSYEYQIGIDSNDRISGLKRLVEAIHRENCPVVFQLAHGGRQTTKAMIGRTPLGPSAFGRDPINMVKPVAMTEQEIEDVIEAFATAAKRAVEAGADGIQLHAAHGYLINQFLSPFFNRRTDQWGGSDKNRFRFFREIYNATSAAVPEDFAILTKLSTNDFSPKEGITPPLALKYAKWMAELGIDCIEVSCGSPLYSFMNMCRGDVPVAEMVQAMPWWKKPLAGMMLKQMVGKFDMEEGYNIGAAQSIKTALADLPVAVVGGMRTVPHMEQVIASGQADLVALSRPFIREPSLVKRIEAGKQDRVSCVSCNRCLAAVVNNFPVRCYHKNFPRS